MSQAGPLDAEGSNPQIPTSFQTDSGIAIPIGNVLEILGDDGITTSGSGNTVTISLEGGSLAIDSIHPDSGTDPVVPNSLGLVNIVGSGSITTVGSLNTLTMQLTGLTNHAVLIGAGTSTITKVGPVASTGAVLQSNGVGSDPGFSTATYPSVTTINQILYSSSANTVTGLATANSGVLTTSAAGVPSIDTTNFQVFTTGVQMKGNNTNTAPPAGFIGEQIRSYVPIGSAITLSSTVAQDLTSISLTAGIWDVTGIVLFALDGAYTALSTNLIASISATSATLPLNYADDTTYFGGGLTAGPVPAVSTLTIPALRVSLAATTTYYFVAYAAFPAGGVTASGRISATRVG